MIPSTPQRDPKEPAAPGALRWEGGIRYGSAVVGVLLATLVRAWLQPLLGDLYPFPTFFVAAMVTAWYAGFGPALLSFSLGSLAAIYLFIPPEHRWGRVGASYSVGIGLYLFVGLTSAALSESLRRARDAAERAQQASKAQARWLQAANEETAAANELLQSQRDELQRLNEQLQDERQRKDYFLAVLGHELRNPLATISNALHLIEPDAVDPSAARRREIIQRQIRRLTRLTDDLLDITRISQGRVLLKPERLDLISLVRECVEDCRGFLEEAGLTFSLEMPEETFWVDGDPERLSQVVGNLLRNAAKFTDPGGRVSVRLSLAPVDSTRRHRDTEIDGEAGGGGDAELEWEREAASPHSLVPSPSSVSPCLRVEIPSAVIKVRDTGIGIAADMLPAVFETFAQGEDSRDRSRGGLGLGLALVKGLVALHGGEVSAASDGPGCGAEFTVRLPLATADAQAMRH